jgi:hypothetical protein
VRPLAAVLLLACGCHERTGFILEVSMHQTSSKAAGVATLELVMATQSWCDRWVEDQGVSGTKVDVHARELSKDPYDFLVEPVTATDIKAPVVPVVLARDANGQLLGEAPFGTLNWSVGHVDKYKRAVELLVRGSQSNGPRYVTDDGCVCLPGQPWMGTGTRTGCDNHVVTSFDRLQDTKDCELPQGSPLPIACDGQQYPNEAPNRDLPCFAEVNGACLVDVRSCQDQNGFAYNSECLPASSAPALPDSTMCDAYLACERNPCGDIIGCLTQALPQEAHFCTLRIALTTDGKMHPCADGAWSTTLPAAACPAALLDGTLQPPFQLGFAISGQTDVQAIAPTCPVNFTVENIDASSYDDVPYSHDLFMTAKDQLLRVHIDIEIGCLDGVPSLICQ